MNVGVGHVLYSILVEQSCRPVYRFDTALCPSNNHLIISSHFVFFWCGAPKGTKRNQKEVTGELEGCRGGKGEPKGI